MGLVLSFESVTDIFNHVVPREYVFKTLKYSFQTFENLNPLEAGDIFFRVIWSFYSTIIILYYQRRVNISSILLFHRSHASVLSGTIELTNYIQTTGSESVVSRVQYDHCQKTSRI